MEEYRRESEREQLRRRQRPSRESRYSQQLEEEDEEEREHGFPFSAKIGDVLRASVTVDSAADLLYVWERLKGEFTVVRMKNKFLDVKKRLEEEKMVEAERRREVEARGLDNNGNGGWGGSGSGSGRLSLVEDHVNDTPTRIGFPDVHVNVLFDVPLSTSMSTGGGGSSSHVTERTGGFPTKVTKSRAVSGSGSLSGSRGALRGGPKPMPKRLQLIAEVQIHHRRILEIGKSEHKLYEIVRAESIEAIKSAIQSQEHQYAGSGVYDGYAADGYGGQYGADGLGVRIASPSEGEMGERATALHKIPLSRFLS